MSAKKKVQQEYYGEAPKTLKDHPFYGMTLNED